MWWRQLRQHNWRYFLDALKERTRSVKYLVHMGTYGNMTAPSGRGNCVQESVTVQKDSIAITAPTYIWAYLQSPFSADEDKKDDIVVIAHNSPYVRKEYRLKKSTENSITSFFNFYRSRIQRMMSSVSLMYVTKLNG